MITILPYSDERAPYFSAFNREWIEELFSLEPKDLELLENPKRVIIDAGGEIWFAQMDGKIVGAFALLVMDAGMMEFSKLGVDKAARGKGVARALLRHCVARAQARGAQTLRIYTSSKLAPANALYVSEGFQYVEMSAAQRAYYVRADVMYDLPLTTAKSA